MRVSKTDDIVAFIVMALGGVWALWSVRGLTGNNARSTRLTIIGILLGSTLLLQRALLRGYGTGLRMSLFIVTFVGAVLLYYLGSRKA